MNHFFIKLVPPRPSFAQDMNDQERKLMQEHIVYWQKLLEKDTVLVYGPVSAPTGAFGMGVFAVESKEVVQELMNNDPTVLAGLNTFEVYPMRAVTKQK